MFHRKINKAWCAPCIQNLKAERKLIEKYAGKDIVFASACLNSDMETWKNLQFRWTPHFLLLNKQGIIVDYGFHLSADHPTTAERIDKLLTEN